MVRRSRFSFLYIFFVLATSFGRLTFVNGSTPFSLNAWRARSPKKESHYKCDTCKYLFSFRRTSFARYLAHPLTVFVLTILVFIAAVFAAGFVMKLLLYLTMDEAQEFIYPADL